MNGLKQRLDRISRQKLHKRIAASRIPHAIKRQLAGHLGAVQFSTDGRERPCFTLSQMLSVIQGLQPRPAPAQFSDEHRRRARYRRRARFDLEGFASRHPGYFMPEVQFDDERRPQIKGPTEDKPHYQSQMHKIPRRKWQSTEGLESGHQDWHNDQPFDDWFEEQQEAGNIALDAETGMWRDEVTGEILREHEVVQRFYGGQAKDVDPEVAKKVKFPKPS